MYAGVGKPEADEAEDMEPPYSSEVAEEDRTEYDDAGELNMFRISAMGIQTVKQFNAAANLLQAWQQCMLTGDLTCSAITTDPHIKRVC